METFNLIVYVASCNATYLLRSNILPLSYFFYDCTCITYIFVNYFIHLIILTFDIPSHVLCYALNVLKFRFLMQTLVNLLQIFCKSFQPSKSCKAASGSTSDTERISQTSIIQKTVRSCNIIVQ